MTDPDTFVATRQALHAVAEHLLAGDLWRHVGRIGLRRTPGGFGQPEHLGTDGRRRRLRVDGTSLVVLGGDDERWLPLDSLAAAAAEAGVQLGAPDGAYAPETSPDAAATLAIDPASAARVADFYASVEAALDEVRRRQATRRPTIAQLWPEHFDLACSIGEVNVGGSPGDAAHPDPYWYVGPWSPRSGPFWNEPWGVSRSWTEVSTIGEAVDFFEEGLRRAEEA